MALVKHSGIVSLPGLILTDLNEARRSDKEFKQRRKAVLKYKVRKITRLKIKHMGDAATFKKGFEELAKNFVKDYTKFVKGYENVLKALVDTILIAQEEEYKQLEGVKGVVDQMERIKTRSPAQFYFPKGVRNKFSKAFRKEMAELTKQLEQEYVEYDALQKGKSINWLKRYLVKRVSKERRGLKAAGKLGDQVKALQTASNQIRHAMYKDTSVELPMLLIHYIAMLHKTDKTMKEVKKDVAIIIEDVKAEAREVNTKLAPFIHEIESSKFAKDGIEAAIKNFVDTRHQIEDNLKDLTKWPVHLEATVKELDEAEMKLLETMSSVGKEELHEAVQGVVKRLMGDREAA